MARLEDQFVHVGQNSLEDFSDSCKELSNRVACPKILRPCDKRARELKLRSCIYRLAARNMGRLRVVVRLLRKHI